MGWTPDHKRMKPRRVRPMNAAEKRHVDRLIAMGCLVCKQPAAYHHIHTNGCEKQLRDHRFGAPLCGEHHQGRYGIHQLGHWGFIDAYDIDLFAFAHEQWEISQQLEREAA